MLQLRLSVNVISFEYGDISLNLHSEKRQAVRGCIFYFGGGMGSVLFGWLWIVMNLTARTRHGNMEFLGVSSRGIERL